MNLATIQVQLQRAQALHQSGRHAEAWLVLAPLRPAIGNHGQALRLYAIVAQAAGQSSAAIDALRQITRIERDPPEIVGALADMLGTAGRHGEALPLWSSLAARRPREVDLHLNHAVTAANAGKPELAVKAADAGLKQFPGHARLLAVKAMALKNAGRIPESVQLFEKAVAADPGRALTRHNQAVALRAACRFDDACEAFAASERLGMEGPQFHANWAAAALEAGDVGKAEGEYRRALDEDPGHQESLEGLARLITEYRDGGQAFDHYEASLRKRGSTVHGWLEWANALIAHYRNQEASDVAERGLREHPGEPALIAAAAFGIGMAGDAAPALERVADAYAARTDAPLAWMAQLAVRAGAPDRAADYAERIARDDPDNQGAWSLLSIAWRLLDDPREHWLCDYEALVMTTDVPSADGRIAPMDYAKQVAAALDPLHQARSAPGNQSLREGTQTSGNLFDQPAPAIQQFRDAVRTAAEKVVHALPDDSEHPFLRRKSGQLGFAGSWSVRLRGGGGRHVSHFHNQGWMSSAYYARLPDVDDAGRRGHEGWIQFGVPPEMYGIDLSPRRLVEPRPGRLVLFPSYLFHGTLPFAAGDRLTAAFDYLPA